MERRVRRERSGEVARNLAVLGGVTPPYLES